MAGPIRQITGTSTALAEINVTPLVDVMLVLLIIFIITIPVINHAVKIDLPRATNQPNDTKPQNINVSVDAQGKVFWNQQEVDDAQLEQRIAEAAQLQPQPELHLRADRGVNPVGADQNIAGCAGAVGEVQRDALVVLREIDKLGMIAQIHFVEAAHPARQRRIAHRFIRALLGNRRSSRAGVNNDK